MWHPLWSRKIVGGLSLGLTPLSGKRMLATPPLGARPINEAVKLLDDVARALAYAQGFGIVHRDIKPDNVPLSGDTAVVTDFDLAKALGAARAGVPFLPPRPAARCTRQP